MAFKLSSRSLERLKGVHPKLVAVVKRAIEISPVDFGVVEGLRDLETQKKYVAEGKSKTLKSKHLKQADGWGWAVDLVAYENGKASYKMDLYRRIHEEAMDVAAKELGTDLIWGGDWDDDGDYKDQTFNDGPHWEMKRS